MTSSIIDRIRKLRALATSDNLHEAQAAARIAEKLIQEANLSEAEIALPEEDESVTREDLAAWSKRAPLWQAILLNGLASQYQCKLIRARTSEGTAGRVYGRKADIEILAYQYAYFSAEICRLYEKSGRRGKAARASYCLGAAVAILETLAAASKEARAQASSAALIKVDTRATAAVNAMRADYPKVTGGKPKAPSDHAAYYHGKRDGASIQQRTALNGHTRMLGQ